MISAATFGGSASMIGPTASGDIWAKTLETKAAGNV
jgi:hypothetical protein